MQIGDAQLGRSGKEERAALERMPAEARHKIESAQAREALLNAFGPGKGGCGDDADACAGMEGSQW
jgi:hypothetical protein